MFTTTMSTLAAAVMLAVPAVAAAQHWGGGRQPGNGACFYKDANFRGAYFCVEAGDELSSLPSGASDEVSSIRVRGRAEVTVFADSRFRGQSRQFDSDVRNLEDEDLNDKISSVQVQGRSFSGGYGGGGGRPSPGAQRDPDRVVRRAYQDLLEREPDASGLRLYRSRIIDDGWTEQEVREDIRKSPEFREKTTMTRAKAEEIVRRAYLAVLKREPDAGSRGFVDGVFRQGWTQQDVERELRRSDEYRNRQP